MVIRYKKLIFVDTNDNCQGADGRDDPEKKISYQSVDD